MARLRPFSDLAAANRDLASWLAEKSQRKHGTTHECVDVRFAREKPHLLNLPPQPCDISERLYRMVNKDCTISVNCNRYVVEHTLVCKKCARTSDAQPPSGFSTTQG